jgi:hypothetical protein
VVPPSRATRHGCKMRKLIKFLWNISLKRENMSLTSGVEKNW